MHYRFRLIFLPTFYIFGSVWMIRVFVSTILLKSCKITVFTLAPFCQMLSSRNHGMAHPCSHLYACWSQRISVLFLFMLKNTQSLGKRCKSGPSVRNLEHVMSVHLETAFVDVNRANMVNTK